MALHTITINRFVETDNSTISTYNISGTTISGYFLERPGPDTVISGQRLRIPTGRYSLEWHNSSIRSVSAYNPVPLLYNASVPKGRYILIHNGNYPRNTDGCLLIGRTQGTDFVGDSVNKLKELKVFLREKGIGNVDVLIRSLYTN